MKFDEIVSIKCTRATSAGIYALGMSSCKLQNEKRRATVKPVANLPPRYIRIAGSAKTAHKIPRENWNRNIPALLLIIILICLEKLPGS
jgi:hypothetical protein